MSTSTTLHPGVLRREAGRGAATMLRFWSEYLLALIIGWLPAAARNPWPGLAAC